MKSGLIDKIILKQLKLNENTPGTRVGRGFHDQTLAVKAKKTAENKNKMIYFFDIPSSDAKIWGLEKRISFLSSPELGEKRKA